MLHHPHTGRINRITTLNDSFNKTPCIISPTAILFFTHTIVTRLAPMRKISKEKIEVSTHDENIKRKKLRLAPG